MAEQPTPKPRTYEVENIQTGTVSTVTERIYLASIKPYLDKEWRLLRVFQDRKVINDVPVGETAGAWTVKQRSGPWFDVVNEAGQLASDKAMKREDAEALATRLNGTVSDEVPPPPVPPVPPVPQS